MAVKRILILTNRVPYPLKDGGALAMHAMITGYRKAGLEVFVLAMNTTRHYVAPDAIPAWLKDGGFAAVDTDTRIRPLPVLLNFLFSSQPEHSVRFYREAYAAKLQELIGNFAPDVIQMESIYLSSYLPQVRRQTKAPVIQRLHNIEYQVWERLAAETAHPVKRFYLRNLALRIKKYEQKIWNDFDLLLPITGADAALIATSGSRTKMLVAPFGIDINESNTTLIKEEWDGYHIGAMDWLPNEEAMRWFSREIWPDLHAAIPVFRFYFAGRNMPEWCREVQEDGLHCMGEVPDAGAFIASKKILIVPLRSGGGIRVKILEAMAAGKLVISTAVGMQGIAAISGVHYLEANNKADFIRQVAWCLDHKPAAEKIALAGRELVRQQYDAQVVTQQVVTALNRL